MADAGMRIAESHNVLDQEHVPTKRGRRPLVDIDPICKAVIDAQPNWVLFEVRDIAEANSVLRQLGKLPGFETTSKTTLEGKSVYVRFRPGRVA